MHEYSVVQALVRQVEEVVRARKASKVHRVRLKLGEAAGVDPELFATALETFKEATVLKDAKIETVLVPARWACRSCSEPIAKGERLQCPKCGAPARQVEGGELMLDQLELEVPDVP
jgi:hydrogenase nickel incorporation protein HypA/HybF